MIMRVMTVTIVMILCKKVEKKVFMLRAVMRERVLVIKSNNKLLMRIKDQIWI